VTYKGAEQYKMLVVHSHYMLPGKIVVKTLPSFSSTLPVREEKPGRKVRRRLS